MLSSSSPPTGRATAAPESATRAALRFTAFVHDGRRAPRTTTAGGAGAPGCCCSCAPPHRTSVRVVLCAELRGDDQPVIAVGVAERSRPPRASRLAWRRHRPMRSSTRSASCLDQDDGSSSASPAHIKFENSDLTDAKFDGAYMYTTTARVHRRQQAAARPDAVRRCRPTASRLCSQERPGDSRRAGNGIGDDGKGSTDGSNTHDVAVRSLCTRIFWRLLCVSTESKSLYRTCLRAYRVKYFMSPASSHSK